MADIDAILFDVGNVLIEWDPRHLYRKVLPSEQAVERFLGEICTSEWHFAHDQGVPFAQNAAPLKARHSDHADLIDMWGERYLEMSPGEIDGMSDLVADVAATGLAVHGLSNMPSSVFPLLKQHFGILDHLVTVVVSGDERVCKPDPRIFELALGRMGTAPARTLFIDDSPVNITAAERLGFQAHHFRSAASLRTCLTELGVLQEA